MRFCDLHQAQMQAPSEHQMDRLTIGMLAAEAGIKITTIRYYERTGLMLVPPRTAGQHRSYTNDHRRRLLFICKARELEFSIEEIKALLALAEASRISCRDVQHIAAIHLEKLRRKIAALSKLEAVLAGTVARCSGKAGPPCPVLEFLEAADSPSGDYAPQRAT
jgi:MerR family mercuric resistance operon transcriptional regulator